MNAEEIIKFIGNAKKQTPVKVYLKGKLSEISFPETIKTFINGDSGVIFGDWAEVSKVLSNNAEIIDDQVIENDSRNSAVPMVDKKEFNARIEPGAVIRDQVAIGNNVVIMMGAIINIGAVIDDNTMIDMGAILGGRATVGKNCHIGAGAVLAGVIEPPSADPVVIEDGVLVGANAVVVEGVRVGEGAVVAAGAIVLEDVAPYTVVAGSPAKVIKNVDAKTKSKTELMDELRKL